MIAFVFALLRAISACFAVSQSVYPATGTVGSVLRLCLELMGSHTLEYEFCDSSAWADKGNGRGEAIASCRIRIARIDANAERGEWDLWFSCDGLIPFSPSKKFVPWSFVRWSLQVVQNRTLLALLQIALVDHLKDILVPADHGGLIGRRGPVSERHLIRTGVP